MEREGERVNEGERGERENSEGEGREGVGEREVLHHQPVYGAER